MIALVLLALGLGVALTAYELSPHTRARTDDYVRAIRDAHAAHRAADVHLSNAGTASVVAAQHAQVAQQIAQQAAPMPMPPAPMPSAPMQPAPMQPVPAPAPRAAQDLANAHATASQVATDAGVDHAIAATEANQAAAQRTADMAKNAKTEAERAAAAQSAAKVLEREKQIVATFNNLGIGQCGVRTYSRVTPQVRDKLLARLHGEGMAVTGNNPWNIDTHQSDVKLRAAWNPKTQFLKLIVTEGTGGFGFMCDKVWERIEPKLKGIIGT